MTDAAPNLQLVPPAEEQPDRLIGQTLDGRYLVEKQLGKGGMGLVYAAKHVMLNKPLAIKVLKQEVSSDEQVMARFRREAQSASSIGSPHICDVSDFGTLPDGATYFVMEFLDGPSLTDAMKQSRPMTVEQILSFGVQMCDALGAAHERGIVHRDLKPDNVHLVNQGGRSDFVKVLDFGIAKVGGAADKKLTQAGQVFGTPHYMSPEQCSGREVDHRTDIYALGVMLYEMACGKVPFDADNLMGVLTKHVYENPIPPREFPPPVSVPSGLESVILKCLTKQPDARYQTMAELKADLERIGSGATPEAVMNEVDRASGVPKTQMIGSSPALQISHGAPAEGAIPADEPASSGGSKVGLLLALAAVLMVVLGAGAFGAAYAFGGFGGEEAEDPEDDASVAADGTGASGLTAPTDEGAAAATDETATETAPAETEPAEAAPATVHLMTDPEGAEVYTGAGDLIGNAPIDIPRPAEGETTRLRLRLSGHEERSFTVSSMTSESVTVRLEEAEEEAAPARTRRRGRRRARPTSSVPTPRPLANEPSSPRPSRPSRPQPGGLGSEIIDPF